VSRAINPDRGLGVLEDRDIAARALQEQETALAHPRNERSRRGRDASRRVRGRGGASSEGDRGPCESASARRATLPAVARSSCENEPASFTVRFTVGAGGGSVEEREPSTDANGVASCGRWTLGAAGDNSVAALVDGVERPAKVTATARRR